MEIPSLPVLHSCLWPGYSTIRLYQNMPPYPRMGSLSGNNTYLSLSGRLDFDSQNKGTSTSARPASRTIATKPGMDCQLQEISPETNSTTGTSRLLLEYKNTASISPDEEVTGPTSLNRTNSGPSSQTDSPCTSQCHYAYSGSNLCDISSSSLHSPPTILQESGCEVGQGLGLTNNAGSRQYRRTSTVVYQSEEVERPLFSPHDTHRDHIRGCQQHRVGMQLDEPHCCSRLLDSRRGESVDQLARTSSSVLCPENLQRTSQLEHTNPNGQHHQPLLYQQAGFGTGVSNAT
ncbi:hypothetical protein G6F42_026255 [Rhizopus arrhizus]|nr:hypothetical protein G6F42_026255 [Rhizopus arrhizus]